MKSRIILFLVLIVVTITLVAMIDNTEIPYPVVSDTSPSVKMGKGNSPLVVTPSSPAVVVAPVVPAAPSTYPIRVLALQQTTYYSSPAAMDMIKVTNPPTGSSLSIPATIAGLARGTWFFEASAPIIVTDAKGKILARGIIEAQGNWMTKEYVPFIANIVIPRQNSGTTGVIVIMNDNPSGDPTKSMSVETVFQFR